MNGHWHAVWVVAANRNSTKCGEGHLSEHCFSVLQAFVGKEAQEVMDSAMGKVTFFALERGELEIGVK